ncbi:MAG TPA: TIGR02757 family protein [Puia sp.]|nr:TIGR02757 family protein [Puia sp.]
MNLHHPAFAFNRQNSIDGNKVAAGEAVNRQLRDLLERKVKQYNHPSFIASDPVSIPHRFSKKQDIEIAGLFAAVFAWGQRPTIIRKSEELMQFMDLAPHDFILHHRPRDLKKLLAFKHRTFNATDLLYFIRFLQFHYRRQDSLESAFLADGGPRTERMKNGLAAFHQRFFSLEDAPERTRKHIATPERNAACKRLNMYLRWMVRQDKQGVDFGLWEQLSPADLICPVDLHVARVARRFGLITRKQTDWETAVELTNALRRMDPKDPVKYDYALFGLGVFEKY